MKRKYCKTNKKFKVSNDVFRIHRETLKNKENPFIGKYYWYKADNYDDSLLMEYYSYKSLDQFKSLYWSTISLNTKIFILYQTAQGLKFLKDNNIAHLDLKPGNILVKF